jgi:hypothetical protein
LLALLLLELALELGLELGLELELALARRTAASISKVDTADTSLALMLVDNK